MRLISIISAMLFTMSITAYAQNIQFPEYDIQKYSYSFTGTMMRWYQRTLADDSASEKDKADAKEILARGPDVFYRRTVKWEKIMRAWTSAHWNELSEFDKLSCLDILKGKSYFGLESCMRKWGDPDPMPDWD